MLNSEVPAASRMHMLEEFNRGVFDYLIATDSSVDQGIYTHIFELPRKTLSQDTLTEDTLARHSHKRLTEDTRSKNPLKTYILNTSSQVTLSRHPSQYPLVMPTSYTHLISPHLISDLL